MSKKEREILNSLAESITKATPSQKEYLLGLAEGMALMSNGKDKKKKK